MKKFIVTILLLALPAVCQAQLGWILLGVAAGAGGSTAKSEIATTQGVSNILFLNPVIETLPMSVAKNIRITSYSHGSSQEVDTIGEVFKKSLRYRKLKPKDYVMLKIVQSAKPANTSSTFWFYYIHRNKVEKNEATKEKEWWQ